MIKVKICGITNVEDGLMASREGADAIGFIFSKRSPRYINPKPAKKIICAIDPFVTKVGIFVNEEKEKVFEIASFLGLDALQFHGNESLSFCHFFRNKFKVIKALFPQDRPFKEKVVSYKTDAFLFDAQYEEKVKGKRQLSKIVLGRIRPLIKEGYRIIISGGLNVNNVEQEKKKQPYGIDVASGVEELVGKKDKKLVRLFIRKVKSEITR
ncbi:MAG: phosphoribosylanthranilate isomerase [Candidatus Omnitrophota bacterium]|nr:MAG: phosphoribosylanthranilate isomerase [Candidatus Omnitrophota bacterium]